MSELVSEHYGCNISCTVVFSKTYGEDTLKFPYKDYNSLNMWQANRDLLSTIYFFVMTHQRKGKKVSILPPGDVNPGHIPSRRGLLKDSPYHMVGVACHRATTHDRTPRAWRPRDVLWSLPQDVNTFL
jgi:hypothetical protein